jgi:hypothetical protein
MMMAASTGVWILRWYSGRPDAGHIPMRINPSVLMSWRASVATISSTSPKLTWNRAE